MGMGSGYGGGEEGGVAEEADRGDGGGDEDGASGLKGCHAAGGLGYATAFDAYGYREAVAGEDEVGRGVDFAAFDPEVGAIDYCGDTRRLVVGGTVVGEDGIEIDGVDGAVDMQFAATAVVEHPIGDVAGLLNLDEEVSGSDGVYAPGGKEVDVGRLGVARSHDFHQCFVFDAASEIVARYFFFKSGIYSSLGFGFQDVPHFGLAVASVDALGQVFVGMDLHREVLARVDYFHEQWHFHTEKLDRAFAKKAFAVFFYELGYCEAMVGTADHNGAVAGNVRQFPALADGAFGEIESFEVEDVGAAPYYGFQRWPKAEYAAGKGADRVVGARTGRVGHICRSLGLAG